MDFPILIIWMNPLSFKVQQEWLFIFILHFITLHRQWNRTVYHGGDTDVPGLRRYRPDAVPVETRLLPASSRFITVFDSLPGYSRWVPVVLNILKQPGTWAGLTRFNTVHPGSPRLYTVPPRLWHGLSRFIPDHQTGVNRHLKPGQWERALHMILSEKWIKKVLIRLRGCASWSAPVLFANPRRQVFLRRGPFDTSQGCKSRGHFMWLKRHFNHVRILKIPKVGALATFVFFKSKVFHRGPFLPPFRSNRGPIASRQGSIPEFKRKHIATCDILIHTI